MANESMVFYKSFFDAIRDLPDSIKLELYDAIMLYGLYEEEPELSQDAQRYYTLIKPQLDANLRRRKNGKYGSLGGRPKQEKPIGLSNIKPIGLSKNNPNVNVNVNDNVNVNVNSKSKKAFTPPTLEEVKAYCIERGNNVDANKFFEYYSTGGWKDREGKPVKNWKQKVITWERDDAPKRSNGFANKSSGEYQGESLKEIEKSIFANK